ncbi:hypothetical protein SAZ10_06145 [Mesorhizobium sp. BAC0120]|uniref:hypothetical protein n=1 Tax=Mesorhizobium sp. BAC0120 TaxID=3090670 RepID=UPI00298C7D0A|nr:hypothetical protein [Mesorhizobium sp. BAC0120]MDW6021344.1 hypothetical protein [Mesorhizobium sp. BAC0120]
MKPYRYAFRHLAATTVIVLLPVASAHALDANAFGTRLKGLVAEQGADINWTSLTESGSQIVLEGVTIGAQGKPDKVNLGDVTLNDVTEENGGYRVGTLTLPNYSTTEEGVTVDISGATINGLVLPAENSNDVMASLMLYSDAKLANVSVKKGDKSLASLENLHVEITPIADGKPLEFSAAAEKFSADLSQTEDAQTKAVIDALGYQSIAGSLTMAGSWQPKDGHIALSKYNLSVENAGTLGMTFDLGGYTPDFIKSIKDLQKQIAAQPAGADNSAQGLAVLGLMQQLTFGSASIRWDDDSLTKKALDFIASQQGQKAEDIANQAKAIVPFAMMQLNNPELTKQVTEAVNKYLTDPKSIEIKAKPGSEVPFAVIMAGAMSGQPQELTKTLAVSVSANED